MNFISGLFISIKLVQVLKRTKPNKNKTKSFNNCPKQYQQ